VGVFAIDTYVVLLTDMEKSKATLAEHFPCSQAPALDQSGNGGYGLATAATGIPLVPRPLLVYLSRGEIITGSWEHANSSKTNADAQNVASFFC